MHHNAPEAAELVRLLRSLRESKGNPTLRAISRMTGGYVSPATLSRMLSGTSLPSRSAVYAVVRALTENQTLIEIAMSHWEPAARQRHRYRIRAAERQSRFDAVASEDPPKDLALQTLQEELRALVRSAGFSIRELARCSGVPRSTISDALNSARTPTAYVVAAIAQACEADRESWPHAVKDLIAPAEVSDQEHQGETDPDPVDILLIETAVTRSPAEIAELAMYFKENGQSDFAARLVELVAKERSLNEVAQLTLELLNFSRPDEGQVEVEVPAPNREGAGWRWWRRSEAR